VEDPVWSDTQGVGGSRRAPEDCLGPKDESVDDSETEPEAKRDRQRPDQVDMHMRKTCRREVEIPKRGLYVPRYLGTLAACTTMCPCVAIFPHSQPHKPLRHHLAGGVGLGLSNAVEGVKDLASETSGYEWPRLWSEMCHIKG
jgi:hypothetical protein